MEDNWVLPPRDLAAFDHLDLTSLTGLTVSQARARVERVGGVLRAVAPRQAMTLDHRRNRITVETDDDQGLVVRVLGRF